MTRVLVCGDRHWKDREYIFERLEDMNRYYGITDIIEGCARGADRIAEEWWDSTWGPFSLTLHHFPAKWNVHEGCNCPDKSSGVVCKFAGIRRNQRMLDEGKPDMVVAFHTSLMSSKGTKDMVQRAQAAGIQTFVFPHHE